MRLYKKRVYLLIYLLLLIGLTVSVLGFKPQNCTRTEQVWMQLGAPTNDLIFSVRAELTEFVDSNDYFDFDSSFALPYIPSRVFNFLIQSPNTRVDFQGIAYRLMKFIQIDNNK